MPAAERAQRRFTIAVVGLGGIGGGAAGSLAAAGRHDVTACVRRAIGSFTLDRQSGVVEAPLVVLTAPEQAKPVDWVLLCTKAHQTQAAAPWLQRLCTPATHVAVLQNGIDHVERVAPLAGDATLVPVLVYYNGERLAPDHVRIRRAGPNDVVVADDEAGHAFAQLLDGTELHVLLSKEFATLAWRKLLINAVAKWCCAVPMWRRFAARSSRRLWPPRAPTAFPSPPMKSRARWQRYAHSLPHSARRCISTGSLAARSKSRR
jgi:2-dehydropantoate 2-reductase